MLAGFFPHCTFKINTFCPIKTKFTQAFQHNSKLKPSAATLCVSATLLSIKGLVQSGSIMTIVLYIDHAWPSLGGGDIIHVILVTGI